MGAININLGTGKRGKGHLFACVIISIHCPHEGLAPKCMFKCCHNKMLVVFDLDEISSETQHKYCCFENMVIPPPEA